jgi:speckle-type POZ protein
MECVGLHRGGSGLKNDLDEFLSNDDFKDITIKIDEKEYKVHKFLLAARSPVMNRLMKNKPEAEEISLIDIPIETFEVVLEFVYDEKFPTDDADFLETYAVAAKLEIRELKEFSAEKLMTLITDDNALEIMALACKYESEKLKVKAFNQIRSFFPDKKLKDELADNPEAVKKLVAAKREIEKFIDDRN